MSYYSHIFIHQCVCIPFAFDFFLWSNLIILMKWNEYSKFYKLNLNKVLFYFIYFRTLSWHWFVCLLVLSINITNIAQIQIKFVMYINSGIIIITILINMCVCVWIVLNQNKMFLSKILVKNKKLINFS